ncbi:hypothetical protein ACIRN4_13385 [Pimelobacter simplex]|uniref:hypothetical protein n=1 Tax=Nocardioides simplex TaxID=2045 RepID=UPI0037F5812A
MVDTSADGRVAFGCALQRGFGSADATTRHYGNLVARELFRAALEAEHDHAVAARLWDADDALVAQDSERAQADLLEVCAAEGLAGTAGLPELRTYMCAMAADLARERPTTGSFGLVSTAARPGDPRRTDASFVGTAQFLLALKVDDDWLTAEHPGIALGGGDDARYQASLREIAGLCSRT